MVPDFLLMLHLMVVDDGLILVWPDFLNQCATHTMRRSHSGRFLDLAISYMGHMENEIFVREKKKRLK